MSKVAATCIVTATIAGCSLISSFDGFGGGIVEPEGGVEASSGDETGAPDSNIPTDGSSSGSDAPLGECPAPTDPALYAWFRFEDGSGKTVNDCSGKGNNGTIDGTGVFTTGRSGGGLMFDGNTTCIDVGLGKAKNLTQFTAAAWVNIDDYDEAGIARYITAVSTDADVRGWRFGSEAGGAFGVKVGQAGGPVSLITPPGRPTKTWIHVGAVYQSGTGVQIFVDGVSVANTPSAPAIIEDNAAHLRFGCFHSLTAPNYHFSGIMDDARLYTRALSAPEMAALAQ